jgi:hypothetical protein
MGNKPTFITDGTIVPLQVLTHEGMFRINEYV